MQLLHQVFSHSSITTYLLRICILGISITLIFLLWGLSKYNELEYIKKNGIDIEIVLDVSYSMVAKDIKPDRLEAAKKVLIEFLQTRESDRVGLVLFSGKAFLSAPLSYDYDFLRDRIQDISVNTIDQRNPELQGTAIWDGLVLASDNLDSQKREEQDREKVIILITDGEANKGIEPEIALKLLKEKNIKTYTIGVGKKESSTIQAQIAPGLYQNLQVWGIDEKILKKISGETGGQYYRADSSQNFEKILASIASLEKQELEMEVRSKSKSLSRELYVVLVVLFGILFWLIIPKNIHYA